MKHAKFAFQQAKVIALARQPGLWDSPYRLSTKGGMPKELRCFISYLKSKTTWKVRMALTIFTAYRNMEYKAYNDFDSILNPPKMRLDLGKFISRECHHLFGLRFHRKIPKSVDPTLEPYFKGGPYGVPGTLGYVQDARHLVSEHKYFHSVLRLWKHSGIPMGIGLAYVLNSSLGEYALPYSLKCKWKNRKKGSARVPAFTCAHESIGGVTPYVQLLVALVGDSLKQLFLNKQKSSPIGPQLDYRSFFFHPDSALDIKGDTWEDTEVFRYEMFSKLTDEDVNILFNQEANPFALKRKYFQNHLAKLIFIPKEGGGTRPVTPVNTLIQTALTPIHTLCMSLLSKQPGDCTYSEELLTKWGELTEAGLDGDFGSIDWTAATDLVPLKAMLYQVVKTVLGKDIADDWLNLLTLPVAMEVYSKNQEDCVAWTGPLKVEKTSEIEKENAWNEAFSASSSAAKIPYAKGAPMGIRALWPVYALAHHCLVNLAERILKAHGDDIDVPADVFDVAQTVDKFECLDLKSDWWTKLRYDMTNSPKADMLLRTWGILMKLLKGDDVALKSRKLTHIYLVLCWLLGIKVSRGKSFAPSEPDVLEFSKRIFARGVELTPLSLKRITSAWQSGFSLDILRVYTEFSTWFTTSRKPSGWATRYNGCASRSVEKLLSRRGGSLHELSAWITCPIHQGKYSHVLKTLPSLGVVQWPDLDQETLKYLLVQVVKSALQKFLVNFMRCLKPLRLSRYGIEVGNEGVRLHPHLTDTHLGAQRYHLPPPVRVLVHLITLTENATEVDILTGRTPYVRALEHINAVTGYSSVMRGAKRHNVRFKLGAGVVYDLAKSLGLKYFKEKAPPVKRGPPKSKSRGNKAKADAKS